MIGALFLTGTGAGLFLLPLTAGYVLGMALGVVLVGAGSLFLLADLSRRLDAWRLVARPQSSWVSRGSIGITSFCVLGFLHVVSLLSQPNAWSSLGAPWVAGPGWMMVMLGLVSLGAGIVSFLIIEVVLHIIGVFFLRYLILSAGVHGSVH